MNEAVLPAGAGARIRARRLRGGGHSQLGTALVLLAVWVAMIVGTSLVKPYFFGVDTFTALSYTAVALMPLCIGLALVTISGSGLDLSGGIVSVIASTTCATLLINGHSSGEVILIVLALGACIGALNGALIAGLGLDPVVTTLAANFIGIGFVESNTRSPTMPADTAIRSFSFGRPLAVTNLLWVALALLVLVDVYLRRTRGGRHVMALGGNPIAAVRQGISRARIRFLVFVFSGACAALGGLMLAGSSDIVSGQASVNQTFQATAAVLLAGVMLTGGRGRVIALIPAVLVLVTIPTAVTTLGIIGAWSTVIQGCVLAVALAIDGLRTRRRNSA